MKRAILAVIFTALSLASFASAAHANNDGQVCFDNGTKVDVVGSHESITVTAPEGKLISGYCVKAGSIKQGLGPEYVEVDPPAASVVITHSSGKDISHYTVTYIDIEDGCMSGELCPPSTTIPPTTVPTTTVPVTTVPVTTVPVTTVTTTAPSTTVAPVTTIVESVDVADTAVIERPTTLAYTGRNSGMLAGLGFALFALGLGLSGVSRRVRL